MVTERVGARAAVRHKNLSTPSYLSQSVPEIIARRAPFVAGAIALDMLSTQLSINAGAMEVGPGTLLFSNLANADPSNPFSAPNLLFHGTELFAAMGMAYGLGNVYGARTKDGKWAAKWFMNGAAGVLGAFGMNNLWDAGYLHGMLPTAGPLDNLATLGLEGLLNYWDFADSTGLGFGKMTLLALGLPALAAAGVSFARKQHKAHS